MSEAFKRRAKKKAKKGRRILVAAMAAAMAFGNIGYVHAAGVDDVFDEHYYADQYPDLKAAFGYSRSALLKHFMKFGLAEGRLLHFLDGDLVDHFQIPDLCRFQRSRFMVFRIFSPGHWGFPLCDLDAVQLL